MEVSGVEFLAVRQPAADRHTRGSGIIRRLNGEPMTRRICSRPCSLFVAAVLGLVPMVAAAAREGRQAPAAEARASGAEPREWIQLFNGRDLADWTIKF